jgi:hypothetical protein
MNALLVRKVLILAANPTDTARLQINQEIRDIEEAIQRSPQRDRFQVLPRWGVQYDELQRVLVNENPQIVHFCGHGYGEGGLALEHPSGTMQLVGTQALSDLFGFFRDKIECVLLNACYSDVQAEAIHQHINCVIGMNEAIRDTTALSFTSGFYQSLGEGRSYADAYRFGRNAIDLSNIPEVEAPVLKLRVRIFISYKRDVEPDEPMSLAIQKSLGQTHQVMTDRLMRVGTKWMEWIDNEIKQSDFLIVLLSKQSVQSEMIQEEVRKALQTDQQQGRPKILPVRLGYREPLEYPLSEYLNAFNWAFWRDESDTPQLLKKLNQAIIGEDLNSSNQASEQELLESYAEYSLPPKIPTPFATAQVPVLEHTQGTMDSDSKFYIERPADVIALNTMNQGGVVVIKAPRQMGKSSLMIRMMQEAKRMKKHVAFLDFQILGSLSYSSEEVFYKSFCSLISKKLQLVNRVEEFWKDNEGQSNALICTYYMEDYILMQCDRSIVLAMDEVESIFGASFRSGFFGMLRSWYNSRATELLWQRLDLALVTSTEPYLWIENLEQSPFNVSEDVELSDFTIEQVTELNHRHNDPLSSVQIQQIMMLLNGHPYLVRRALYLVASNRLSAGELFRTSSEDRGPFGDHLRHFFLRMSDNPELVRALTQIVRSETCDNEKLCFRLQSAGLVQIQEKKVTARCQLYQIYFQEHLRG